MNIGLSILCLGAVVAACTNAAPEEPLLGTTRQSIKSDEARVPTDLSPQATAPAKKIRRVTAPAFRPATRDEIEALNGTYRTEGSWDRLLRFIEAAEDEETKERLVARLQFVTRKLPAEMRSRARAKADVAAQKAGVRK